MPLRRYSAGAKVMPAKLFAAKTNLPLRESLKLRDLETMRNTAQGQIKYDL
jgi:hypothetical protein